MEFHVFKENVGELKSLATSIFYYKGKFLNGITWNSTGKQFHVSRVFKENYYILTGSV